jgi:hypothetical protein
MQAYSLHFLFKAMPLRMKNLFTQKEMKRLAYSFVLLIAVASCSNPEKEIKNIEALQKKVYEHPEKPDKDKAKELDAAYKAFFHNHPNDTNVPSLNFEDGRLNMELLGNYPEGFRLLDEIVAKYPQHRRAPDALQYEAFIYDTRLQRPHEAKEQSHWAKEASFYMKSIGKTDEEILNDLQAKQHDSVSKTQ